MVRRRKHRMRARRWLAERLRSLGVFDMDRKYMAWLEQRERLERMWGYL